MSKDRSGEMIEARTGAPVIEGAKVARELGVNVRPEHLASVEAKAKQFNPADENKDGLIESPEIVYGVEDYDEDQKNTVPHSTLGNGPVVFLVSELVSFCAALVILGVGHGVIVGASAVALLVGLPVATAILLLGLAIRRHQHRTHPSKFKVKAHRKELGKPKGWRK